MVEEVECHVLEWVLAHLETRGIATGGRLDDAPFSRLACIALNSGAHAPPLAAKIYETSTETLFVGRQDAMQRGTLVPLRDFMAGKDASQMSALEVAAGTGRFAT